MKKLTTFIKISLLASVLFLPFSIPQIYAQNTTHLINVNKIILPLNHVGVLADININGMSGGYYEGGSILFSGGFYMSGIGDSLWGNGCLTASRIQDYKAGAVNDSLNPLNKLYVVTAADDPFGSSWQEWNNAVTLGAPFYDGNGDGIYNPIDLNGNGQWDPNEDKPMLTGNVTTWCLYNDGVNPTSRRYFDVLPQKLEIAQTVFAFSNSEFNLNEAIFVKYSITNKGTINQNEIYFSFAADADIDPYYANAVGSDSLLQMIYTYVYNDSTGYYGINAPAVGNVLILGPHEYIAGITFTDINGNGIYDNGIDIPLDTAYKFVGAGLPFEALPGAMNVKMNGTQYYMSSHPTLGDPSTKYALRNYLLAGMFGSGTPINPCTFTFGNGSTLPNCSSINPKFIYSGDPEAGTGWLNILGLDTRMMANVGAFSLSPNETKEIIYAFITGRGTSHKNSVTVLKNNVPQIKEAFKNNFPVVIGIKDNMNFQPDEFILFQNYPNPFNPVTKIKFSVPVVETFQGISLPLTIKVYDILGKEISTLINQEMKSGVYEVEFDGSQVPSGVYFYQLRTENFVQTKKMILLK